MSIQPHRASRTDTMPNEPQVQHPPIGTTSDAPSLADLLAARPMGGADDGLGHAAHGLHSSYDVPTPTLSLARGFQASLASHSEAIDATPGYESLQGEGPTLREESGLTATSAHAPLLLVHAGQSEGALIKGWMRNVLRGQRPHIAHFQEAVADLVQHHQPHAVLVQFDPRCVDAAVSLVTHLKTHYPLVPRLAVGRTRDASCMLAALRAGVQDFLDIDASIEIAQQAVQLLVDRPPSVTPDASRAPQTVILSARAGVGSSLLAAHLSWYLQAQLSRAKSVDAGGSEPTSGGAGGVEALAGLLIELGTPGGDCAIYLNTLGEFSFSDAVAQQLRLDRRMAQSALARHESGLRILTQARQPHLVSSKDVSALLKRLSQCFRHIVLDLGGVGSPQLAEGVLPEASEIWVVCDQSVASVVWTTELLQQAEKLHIARDRMKLVVSRHDPRLELSAQQIERQLSLPLLAVLPERRRELSEVVNQGRLFAPANKREPYVHAVEKLVAHLISAYHPEIATSEPRSRKTTSSPIARLLQSIRKN